jgi:hypothetical protein
MTLLGGSTSVCLGHALALNMYLLVVQWPTKTRRRCVSMMRQRHLDRRAAARVQKPGASARYWVRPTVLAYDIIENAGWNDCLMGTVCLSAASVSPEERGGNDPWD